MQNLINFLIRYNSWLFFAALETVCLILVFTYNPYQERVYISSANQISGQLYTGLSQISEYFYLRSKNEELVKENNDLLQQVLLLNQYIADNEIDSVNPGIFTNPLNAGQRYEFVPARVIGNSITRTHNYITLNKGSQSGLKSGLGVIDQNGVVGVIGNVSEKYAVVIPILNPQFRLSVKLKKNNYFGSLVSFTSFPAFWAMYVAWNVVFCDCFHRMADNEVWVFVVRAQRVDGNSRFILFFLLRLTGSCKKLI